VRTQNTGYIVKTTDYFFGDFVHWECVLQTTLYKMFTKKKYIC